MNSWEVRWPMNGILNVNKPAGMTSHDVVLAVRRLLKEKRVGHTGTLDPMATGVLVLCIGKATRIARYLESGDKEYHAIMRLGVTTDTLDAQGRVLETRSCGTIDRSRLLKAFGAFTGEIMQTPPAYSAVKVGGVPSYRLARAGKAEPLKPRKVAIHHIELTGYEDPSVSIAVRCSKGVYIRSLCADIGEALGTGAHLTSLSRLRSGRFVLEQAITLGHLADAAESGNPQDSLISLDEALADFPGIAVGEAESDKIRHGSHVLLPPDSPLKMGEGIFRVHDSSGSLLALVRRNDGKLEPELVFS